MLAACVFIMNTAIMPLSRMVSVLAGDTRGADDLRRQMLSGRAQEQGQAARAPRTAAPGVGSKSGKAGAKTAKKKK